jgi:hypothetical protein
MYGVVRLIAALIALTILLVGCASKEEIEKRIAGRWGPDPIINADDANSVVRRQVTVLFYIAQDSGIHGLTTTDDPRWFEIAQWGFNVGREDCASYLNNLFRIQRERLRNHDILNAFQVASIGIVTAAAPSSATTLSVLGQAFGLASSLNDAVLQSYLFTEAPGLISIKVKKLQDDYQNSLARGSITSAAQAYSALQNYYNICLPQSIEGIILEKVAASDTTSGDKPKAGDKPTAAPINPKGTSTVIQKTPKLTQ